MHPLLQTRRQHRHTKKGWANEEKKKLNQLAIAAKYTFIPVPPLLHESKASLLKMAHQLQLSLVLNDQTSPSLPLLQAKESIISHSQDDSTTEQGSTSPKRDQDNEEEIESARSRNEEITILGLALAQVGAAEEPSKGCDEVLAVAEDSGRERLRKHRVEVAGRVWIPDIWGQEEFLKDWADCTVFDDSLFPNGIMSARSALIEEGRRGTSGILRIENRC